VAVTAERVLALAAGAMAAPAVDAAEIPTALTTSDAGIPMVTKRRASGLIRQSLTHTLISYIEAVVGILPAGMPVFA